MSDWCKVITAVSGACFLMLALSAAGQQDCTGEAESCSCPSWHLSDAPTGVMGDHLHAKGSWMLSYRYMHMDMEGLGHPDGAEEVDVSKLYSSIPQSMNMDMHMFGLMYAPGDKLTLMAMQSFYYKRMDMVMDMHSNMDMHSGMDMTMSEALPYQMTSAGLSDLKLQALISIFRHKGFSGHGNVGLSIPAGSILVTGDSPMQEDMMMAYPMQNGSGTFDPMLGLTALWQNTLWASGFQANYVHRIGDNSQGYHLSDAFQTSFWGACKISKSFQWNARLTFSHQQSISGADKDMDPLMMPLANPYNSGGKQLSGYTGFALGLPLGQQALRFSAEAGLPLNQNLNGWQMQGNYQLLCGLQYGF